jgi:acetyl-CoA acetyltransferase
VARGKSTLRGKYAIVGVGETNYSRNSGRTTRAMAAEAIRNALDDSGIDIANTSFGITSYSGGDAAGSAAVMSDLGIRLDYEVDTMGGGSSTETLIGLSIGVMEAGLCDAMVVHRTMNGYTEQRIGGTPVRPAGPPAFTTRHGDHNLHQGIYGVGSALQSFALAFVRHMYEFGTTSEQLAHVKVAHSKHASNNPKAYYKERVTVEDVLNSRFVVEPFHLLDCCVETDNATAIVITSVERARDLRHPVTAILGTGGRAHKAAVDYAWGHAPITLQGGIHTKDIVFSNAGVGPEDIDLTGSYDAFTFTSLMQLEAYGFCKVGEGGDYVSSGIIELGGARPNNTSGGHLCEAYTHGMNMVIENVRQLRGTVDDYCPEWQQGKHTYDYSERGCRQVRDPELTMNLGWAQPATSAAMIMTNQI